MMRKGSLDKKLCWEVWASPGGSLGKVQELLTINPRTGKRPYLSGIRKQAFAWVVGRDSTPERVASAREQFAYKKMTEEAIVVTDELWKDVLVEMAKVVYEKAPLQLERFLVRHGLNV